MKTQMGLTSTALMTLVGLSQAALADSGTSFTPVEDLAPEQRQQIYQSLSTLGAAAEFDWENVVVGVDDQQNIIFMKKDEAGMQIIASPSSFCD